MGMLFYLMKRGSSHADETPRVWAQLVCVRRKSPAR